MTTSKCFSSTTGLLLVGCVVVAASDPASHHDHTTCTEHAVTFAPVVAATNSIAATELAPLPAGVEELLFSEIYKSPVGPRGLEFSAKARSLEKKQVRLVGHVVRQCAPIPGCVLLAPTPLTLHEHEYGHADDLPPTLVHVFLPERGDEIISHQPGQRVVIGTLSLGNREEADGRISRVRIALDAATTSAAVITPVAETTNITGAARAPKSSFVPKLESQDQPGNEQKKP